jgi:hypothetical protein
VGIRAQKIHVVADGTLEQPDRFRIRGWPDAYLASGQAPVGRPTRIRAVVTLADGTPQLRILGG